jgi:predicted acyltransferase
MATDLSSSFAVTEKVPAALSQSAGKVPPAPQAGEGRLVSLDTFRGFIMFWIIGGEALAAGLQALKPNFLLNTLVYELNHTPWQGLRFYDCIWPSFMLMVGVSVPLSFAKRSRTQTYLQMLGHAVKRFAVLFLLGSLRQSIHRGAPYWVELSSALQP